MGFVYNKDRSVEDNVNAALESGDIYRYAQEYAEPGYDDPEKGILVADWNPLEMRRLEKVVEEAGYSIEWCDEWQTCTRCDRLFRSEPDCYEWQMYGVLWDGDSICGDCVVEDPEEYLDYVRNSASRAVTFDFDFEANGYQCVRDDFQHGWYGGQDADPRVIAKTLEAAHIDDFVFKIDNRRQFDIDFSVWVPVEFFTKAKEALEEGNTKADMDPKEGLRRGLQAAAGVPQAPPGMVTVTNVDTSTGTAEARHVSQEDFLAGKR